jgi:predicted metal-binding protein
MTKIGIIRCQETSLKSGKDGCAGWNCLSAVQTRSAYFDEYDAIELVGLDTCGGCPGKNNVNKIVERGLRLVDHGAEVIHLSSCLVGFCPHSEMFRQALEEKVPLPIKKRTHGGPDGKRIPLGPDGKTLMPEDLYPPKSQS